jgi:hypothetical protein
MTWTREQLTKEFIPPSDAYLNQVKATWFDQGFTRYDNPQLIPKLDAWFQSTQRNTFDGWDSLSCVDVTMGNTHYIESFIIRNGWNGFQVLTEEYAYYGFNGKWGVEPGNLKANVPLIITLPHYKWAGIRPEWPAILRECEEKNIDIHIDMAWAIMAKNINIDFAHPCIQSIGMSISKYTSQWLRVGLRYSKQRTMDSITMFNHYYRNDTNLILSSATNYFVDHVPRDYAWDTYELDHMDICRTLDLIPTDLIHVVREDNGQGWGIGNMLSQSIPHSK